MFHLEEIKAFQSDFCVIHKNGKPFYWTKRKVEFNLPVGIYEIVSGNVIDKDYSIEFKKFRLPKAQRVIEPKQIIFSYGENPNKATVNLDEGTAVLDYSLQYMPDYCLDFVKAHEYGHFFYKSEHLCDMFAANVMLDMGYNPFQIHLAAQETLRNSCRANGNTRRMKRILRKGKKYAN